MRANQLHAKGWAKYGEPLSWSLALSDRLKPMWVAVSAQRQGRHLNPLVLELRREQTASAVCARERGEFLGPSS
jgi:hypothetical protein